MASKKENEDLLKRLLAIFQVEAAEHLKSMSVLLQALENPAPADEQARLVEALFREAHSLKGAARSVNLSAVETVCKALEGAMSALKTRQAGGGQTETLAPAWFETVYRALDGLEGLLAAGVAGQPPQNASDMTEIVRQLEALETPDRAAGESPPAAVATAPPERPPAALAASGDTVRISTARLTALLVQAEELLAFKFSAGHLVGELRALDADVAQWKKTWSRTARDGRTLRRAQEKHGGATGGKTQPVLDKLLDAIERDELAVKAFAERLVALERLAEQERRMLAGMVDGLQADMRQVLMLPFGSLLELIPKLVRDLAHDSGKDVKLRIEGAAIEIDRRILEQMKDPLIHLVRNAIDHGIETTTARRGAHKPVPGCIAIGIAAKEGNRVELTVADDGAGVDLEKLKAAARKLGLIAVKDAVKDATEGVTELSNDATLALMFESGLTTSPILTDLSGRGLGLAIVREKAEQLGGSVAAELPADGGTLFRVVLPTTLATFRGLLVGLGERQFVLPSRSVERVLRMPAASVKTVENRAAVEIGGQAVALVRLADALGLPGGGLNGADLQLAVLEGAGRRIAFAVDAILGDQEVLVKSLGPQLRRVPNVAGATVLGPGRVVPILNVADLLKSAQRVRPQTAVPPAPTLAQRQQSLLVVEDSITARSLLKNILESAGYRVETAVDGIDALTALKSEQFDLVVSDVEMPRMDGFELTARVRADKKLAELPVVLVTALESREHKERGIEVGANAYIVKSSFDQSNLFAVIRRLL